jgi:transposase
MSAEPEYPPPLAQLLEDVTSEASLRDKLGSFARAQLINVIVLMWMVIRSLRADLKDLKAAKNLNSHDSSKPPSSDGYDKPAPKSQRKRSGRKTGGQPGHAGITLEKSSKPDKVILVQTARYCECGLCLDKAKVVDEEARQVFDTPEPPPLECTEYRGKVKKCSCGRIHRPVFPGDVSQPTQYGPRVQAHVSYLHQHQKVPYGRTQEAMDDLFAVKISQGTIKNIMSRGHDDLGEFVDDAKQALIVSEVVGFDETGMRRMKKLVWLHAASNDTVTVYHIDPDRGTDAMNRMGILPNFRGTAVHDGLPAYFMYTQCLHGLCNAHHLRELTFALEQYEQHWAGKLIALLVEANNLVNAAKQMNKTALPRQILDDYSSRYTRILANGQKELPVPPPRTGKRGRPKNHKVTNLLHRLLAHKEAALAFMFNFQVPFTNNQRERDVRTAKVKQKISGCFRSLEGANIFARFHSYISTARKQDHTVLQALTALYQRNWGFIRRLTRPDS